jgi:hypothetical protein
VKSHIILSDFQIPYHDPQAVEVAMQIGEDLKPETLFINGDFGDYRVLSTKYPMRSERPELVSELREEVHRQREILHTLVKRIKAKKKKWNDGNHEFRIFNTLSKLPQVLRLLEIESVANSLSVPEVLGLRKLGFSYAGEYPTGQWLTGNDIDHNVWVEHGYILRQKSGYLANALVEKRMASCVTGHCERLALIWRNVIGGRTYFAAEGGNLSILGTAKGNYIYSTVPQNVGDYRDSQQGFVVLWQDGNSWYPQTVRIVDGRTIFNGRLYKA